MKDYQSEIINKVSKGSKQRQIATMLLEGKRIKFGEDYCDGYTCNYNSRRKSFNSLIERFNKLGFSLDEKLGRNGGLWTATFKLKSIKKVVQNNGN